MNSLIGQQWGNYRLTRLLGQGGFAEVYLGEHARLAEMKAAIKILHTHLSSEEVASFQQEASIIARLVHPNIVRILDFDVHQGKPFLVLAYAPQGSLRYKHPRGSKLPLAQVIEYVKQIASALQFAHDQKLIHRDIKPENMLLGAHGEVILSDFGIATIAHSTSSMHIEAVTGTLAYMAPEQIQGKPRPASDQYALGVMVYQWLSGAIPFRGSSAEIMAQHLMKPPESLRTRAPELPQQVEEVVMKALAKDPKERFDSVQAFAQALEQAASEVAIPETQQQTDTAQPASPEPYQPSSSPTTAKQQLETMPLYPSDPPQPLQEERPVLAYGEVGAWDTLLPKNWHMKMTLSTVIIVIILIAGGLWWVESGSGMQANKTLSTQATNVTQMNTLLSSSDAGAPYVTIVTVQSSSNGIDVQADVQNKTDPLTTCTMDLEIRGYSATNASTNNFGIANQDYSQCNGSATLHVDGISTQPGDKITLTVTIMGEGTNRLTYNYNYATLEVPL